MYKYMKLGAVTLGMSVFWSSPSNRAFNMCLEHLESVTSSPANTGMDVYVVIAASVLTRTKTYPVQYIQYG
jgi:hypothetical protein